MKYRVIINHTEEGFDASCPRLPGCFSQGETREEALENITIAIREYLEAVDEMHRDKEFCEVEVAA